MLINIDEVAIGALVNAIAMAGRRLEPPDFERRRRVPIVSHRNFLKPSIGTY